ncbi:hypothetical protein T02_15788 [Trichinella nativa]|uniref:Uncharacterized protein n=2 Tax=Trichinella nativa TaxID=6335 RepID=A0A0V1LIK9_9BILA|nr:hypothetical protein T02_15788 [Trichinella nativa]
MERVNVLHTRVGKSTCYVGTGGIYDYHIQLSILQCEFYLCFNSPYSRKWKNTCTVVHDITFRLQVSGSSEEAYINGIRYGRKFSAIYVKKNCPIAVCERPCASFQMFRNCPYCDCNGFIYREPCISMEDCRFGGVCEYYICRYTSTNALF